MTNNMRVAWAVWFVLFMTACDGKTDNNKSDNQILTSYVLASIMQDVDIYVAVDDDKEKRLVAFGLLMKLGAIKYFPEVDKWRLLTLGAFCFLDSNFDDISGRVDEALKANSRSALDSVMPDVYRVVEERKIMVGGKVYLASETMKYCYTK